ncbi:14639_t:CDS:2 [Dentiscutata erythropus]|uniref:14639_t:CDS:1 n=1 Tax=Dentiscutata erythropus TaxID=1348616 RepID=A0A9N8W0T0_9GLOM|nr:14639_t:CDS:2 [Dentiscutata erythropus]
MNQATNVQPQNNHHQRLPNIGGSQRTQGNQHNANLSINATAVQRYDELVEGGNPFSGLRGSEIPLQNTEFQTIWF